MSVTPKVLAQLRPSGTGTVQLYSPNSGEEIVATLSVTTVDVEAEASIFIDDDGTTYDEDTALEWELPIIPKNPAFEKKITMSNSNGSIGVQSSVADALNFTLMGIVKTA